MLALVTASVLLIAAAAPPVAAQGKCFNTAAQVCAVPKLTSYRPAAVSLKICSSTTFEPFEASGQGT